MTAVWTGADADAIAGELARVILGGRGPQRTEQRMDATGAIARQIIAFRIFAADVGAPLAHALLVWPRQTGKRHLRRLLEEAAS